MLIVLRTSCTVQDVKSISSRMFDSLAPCSLLFLLAWKHLLLKDQAGNLEDEMCTLATCKWTPNKQVLFTTWDSLQTTSHTFSRRRGLGVCADEHIFVDTRSTYLAKEQIPNDFVLLFMKTPDLELISGGRRQHTSATSYQFPPPQHVQQLESAERLYLPHPQRISRMSLRVVIPHAPLSLRERVSCRFSKRQSEVLCCGFDCTLPLR